MPDDEIPQATPVDLPDEEPAPEPLRMVLHGPIVVTGGNGVVTVYHGEQLIDLAVVGPQPAPEQETP